MIWFLFPGQGSQKPGMARDYYEMPGPARDTFDEAEAVLGTGFIDSVFTGTQEALTDTRLAQVALVTTDVAIARHLIAAEVAPDGTAGHSVGEIAALVVADALDFGDAIRLVRERARLMAEESGDGTMAAVLGLDPDAIAAALPEEITISNFNGPNQTIVSGAREAMEEAKVALTVAGAKRVIPLNVSGPFHCAQMKPAALKLRDFIADIPIRTPAIRFVSSVTGVHESSPDTIRDLIWKQVYSPVRWTEVMETLGPVRAIEAGPGNILQGMAKRTEGAPDVSTAATLEQAKGLALI